MPLGSSSAAPVINPALSRRQIGVFFFAALSMPFKVCPQDCSKRAQSEEHGERRAGSQSSGDAACGR